MTFLIRGLRDCRALFISEFEFHLILNPQFRFMVIAEAKLETRQSSLVTEKA